MTGQKALLLQIEYPTWCCKVIIIVFIRIYRVTLDPQLKFIQQALLTCAISRPNQAFKTPHGSENQF